VRLADLGLEAQDQVRAQLAEQDRPPRPEAREPDAPPDPLAGATGLERRYAAWLEEERLAGRVLAWRYEPLTLVLRRGAKGGKGLRYSPDFAVMVAFEREDSTLDARLELVEVKPEKGNSVLWLGDSRTKVLSAAESFRWAPWHLVLVWPAPGGWGRQVL
jgi:hypothetical protein